MTHKTGENKTEPRFDVVIFHYIDKCGWFRKTRYAYGTKKDPHAGDKFLEDCRTLGGAVWPVGRTVHVFMPLEGRS